MSSTRTKSSKVGDLLARPVEQHIGKPLTGRVAIVTGAGSGIGKAVATRYAKEGATVVGIDVNGDALESLRSDINTLETVTTDIRDHDKLEDTVKQTIENHGRIDILVNNAGFSFYASHEESTLEQWRQTMSVNAEGMYVLAKLVTPHMIARRYGRIVNMSSTQARSTEATVSAYTASKGAIEAWTRALAVDLAPHNIIVNAVAPGCIHTPMSIINGVDETQTEFFKKWYVGLRKIPLARAGEAEEVANAIYFLSGDQCNYITGQTIVVDGGLTITF